jgi:hypothetical protein
MKAAHEAAFIFSRQLRPSPCIRIVDRRFRIFIAPRSDCPILSHRAQSSHCVTTSSHSVACVAASLQRRAEKASPPKDLPSINAGADSANQVNCADDPTHRYHNNNPQKEGRAP